MNCLRRFDAVSISVAVVLATGRFWKVTSSFVLVEAVDTVAVDTFVAGVSSIHVLYVASIWRAVVKKIGLSLLNKRLSLEKIGLFSY